MRDPLSAREARAKGLARLAPPSPPEEIAISLSLATSSRDRLSCAGGDERGKIGCAVELCL